MTEERIARTFETGDSAEVSISNVEGTIEIQGWDRPEVEIVAVRKGNNGDTIVEIGGEGSRAWAKTRPAQGLQSLFGWLKRGDQVATVDYTVHVPRTSSVSASGVSGPIHVAGIHRTVNVHSVNGYIALEDLAGDISADTVNSTIEGRRLDGTLVIETVSGRADLSDSRLSSLRAESIDGSIQATGQIDNLLAEAVNGTVRLTTRLNPDGEYAVKSVNGSFHLAVPRDTACEVAASGLNVNVTCELPHTVEESRWGRWSGQVNDVGGADVTFSTVNGTLTIVGEETPAAAQREPMGEARTEPVPVMPEPAVPVEPAAAEDVIPEPAAPPVSKMDILKAVERGEMRVEDALERLRNLN